MPKQSAADRDRYTKQRPKVSPPVVSTAVLRKALKLTLQDVCDHMRDEDGITTDRGTISAIENGHRGASTRMLAAYADALGITADVIDTQYEPRQPRERADAVAS
jgi:transcriptional regulator with XRE-family HTH domain